MLLTEHHAFKYHLKKRYCRAFQVVFIFRGSIKPSEKWYENKMWYEKEVLTDHKNNPYSKTWTGTRRRISAMPIPRLEWCLWKRNQMRVLNYFPNLYHKFRIFVYHTSHLILFCHWSTHYLWYRVWYYLGIWRASKIVWFFIFFWA